MKPRTQYVIITVCGGCGDGVVGGTCALGAPAAAATAASPCASTPPFCAAAYAAPRPHPSPDVHSKGQCTEKEPQSGHGQDAAVGSPCRPPNVAEGAESVVGVATAVLRQQTCDVEEVKTEVEKEVKEVKEICCRGAGIKARGNESGRCTAESKPIDPWEAACAVLLLVSFACMLASKAVVRTGLVLQRAAFVCLVASLAPLLLRHFVEVPRPGDEGCEPKRRRKCKLKCKPRGADVSAEARQSVVPISQPVVSKEKLVRFTRRVKLYKLRDCWEELGIGDAELVMCTATREVRFTFRSELTGSCLVNLGVAQSPPGCGPRPSVHSEFCSVWCVEDPACSAGHAVFAVKFAARAAAREFEASFAEARAGRAGSSQSDKA